MLTQNSLYFVPGKWSKDNQNITVSGHTPGICFYNHNMLFLILPEMCPLHLTCFQHRVIGCAVFFLFPSQKHTITVDFMTNKMNKFSRGLYHHYYTNNTIYTDTLRDYLFLPPPTPPEVFIFILKPSPLHTGSPPP